MLRHIARFAASNRQDFFRLHDDAHNAGLCFCVAWWVNTWDGWGERSAAQNRALRETLCDRGEYDGYLLYVDDTPAGWCQVGPRDRLEKLVHQFNLTPDSTIWALTCFLIAPAYCKQGHAAYLLNTVLDDLSEQGIQRIEAFPKRGADLQADDLWNGPEAMYVKAGFHVVRDDAQRPVLALNMIERG